MNASTILNEILAEREQQKKQGFDAAHDDALRAHQWEARIVRYVARATILQRAGSPALARRRLVQVAALALAAVEALDRAEAAVAATAGQAPSTGSGQA